MMHHWREPQYSILSLRKSSSLITRVNHTIGYEVDANIPSTLPITVDVGVEEISELRVDNVGTHTIRGKSSVVDLGTVVWSEWDR